MQQSFINFISFIKIVDLSLLSLIDHYDLYERELPVNENGQIFIALSSKNKNLLTAFIIEHLLNSYEYGKTNIIINTCKPMLNWRQHERTNGAIKSYRYTLHDNSIYIDLIQLNKWLDSMFKKLPKLKIDSIKNDIILKDTYIKNFKFYQNKMHFIEFENIDISDCYLCCASMLSEIASVNFDNIQYNILQDGNHAYQRTKITRENIHDIIRLKLLEIGIL